jgi:hypothetical protein
MSLANLRSRVPLAAAAIGILALALAPTLALALIGPAGPRRAPTTLHDHDARETAAAARAPRPDAAAILFARAAPRGVLGLRIHALRADRLVIELPAD